MRMSNRGRITRAAVLTVLTAVLGLSLAGCKHTTTENLTSTIAIVNDCGADIDVYMDGALKTTVAAATQGAITDVAAGSRLLEAKLKGTSDLVLSETKTITAGTTVSFTVTGQAVLRISFNDTATTKIYTNATY